MSEYYIFNTEQEAIAAEQEISIIDGFSVGSLRGALVGNYYSNIAVQEIVVPYSAITDSDRQKLEGYLAWKWGLESNLPIGHPYKTTPPTV